MGCCGNIIFCFCIDWGNGCSQNYYGNTVVIADHNLGVHFYADLSAWELSKNLSPLITLSMEDRYFINDQELAVNNYIHLELSEDEVDPTQPPPGVNEATLIIDEKILFEECKDFDDEEDTLMSLMRI